MLLQALTPETAGINSDLQAFTHDLFGTIRGITIDGEPYVLGKDLATALGYKRAAKAIQDRVNPADRGVVPVKDSIGRLQDAHVINENGVYDLILDSKLKQAKAFRRWVVADVLPSIRKHGGYLTPAKLDEVEADPEARDALIADLRAENTALLPKAEFYDRVLEDKEFLSVTAIALELGTSARILNKRLEELGVQHKATGGGWIPAYEYDDCEYVKIYEYKNPAGVTGVRTLWTQAGRQLIKDLLTNKGVA